MAALRAELLKRKAIIFGVLFNFSEGSDAALYAPAAGGMPAQIFD
jgi:hypothetical protein